MPRAARICWVLTVLYWCGLFALTHTPGLPITLPPGRDTTAHFISYAILAMALFVSLYLWRKSPPARIGMLVLGVLLAYGAIDEWTQILVNRSCELADWFADAAGAAVAVVLMTLVLWRLARG